MLTKLSQFKKGFTIVEMLMVLAIFTILTSVVMYNYAEFNSKTIMSNMAYEIALSVRQAQVFSLGVRGRAGTADFDNRYGVYFNTEINEGKNFVFFFDRKETNGEPNGWCDGTSGEPNCLACVAGGDCVEKVALTRDIYIARICISDSIDPVDTETGLCIGQDSSSKNQASITFDRPNPDVKIKTDKNEGEMNKNIAIVVKNSFGNQRAVIIRSTGQISVIMLGDAS